MRVRGSEGVDEGQLRASDESTRKRWREMRKNDQPFVVIRVQASRRWLSLVGAVELSQFAVARKTSRRRGSEGGRYAHCGGLRIYVDATDLLSSIS
jgi:hypothetical protein